MQAVILAGGLGMRLRPLTHVTPKLMLNIYGRPFLEHHILSLREQGIKDIVLLIGYLGDKIKDYFKDGSAFGVNIAYSVDKQLGTGGAIKNASHLLGEDFIVLNGDTYLPIDYEELIGKFQESKKLGMITIYDNRHKIAKNNVFLRDDRVVEYKRAGAPHFTHVDAGVSMFKKEALNIINKGEFSMENDLYPALINMDEFGHFLTSERFFDIHILEKVENVIKCLEVK